MSSNLSSCDLTGGTRAEAALAAYVSGGRLPHAILVEGHAATLAFAKKIAKAALCSSGEIKPCGICRDCQKAEKDAHPDIIVRSGGDKPRSFHIDTVRELRQEAYIKPNEADGRVFILENAQNMTVQAQNALLKIIEEPPAGVTFILTCVNKAALLETVLSRVAVFSAEGEAEPDGEELTELKEKAAETLNNLLSGSELSTLAAFAPYERDRAGFAKFLSALRGEAAEKLLAGTKSGGISASERDRLLKLNEIIDALENVLDRNVGGLLLTALLPAKFKM